MRHRFLDQTLNSFRQLDRKIALRAKRMNNRLLMIWKEPSEKEAYAWHSTFKVQAWCIHRIWSIIIVFTRPIHSLVYSCRD